MSGFADADLIARVLLDDDRSAFGELVRRYQSDVRALVRKMAGGDAALADDIAQETFIKAYRNLGRFQGTARFSTWLYRIAYNTFVSSTRARRPEAVANMDVFESDSGTGHDEQALARITINRAAARLSSPERTALALSYGRQLPHDEIAAVMECPVGTVKTHILRGKEKLKAALTKRSTEAVP